MMPHTVRAVNKAEEWLKAFCNHEKSDTKLKAFDILWEPKIFLREWKNDSCFECIIFGYIYIRTCKHVWF